MIRTIDYLNDLNGLVPDLKSKYEKSEFRAFLRCQFNKKKSIAKVYAIVFTLLNHVANKN